MSKCSLLLYQDQPGVCARCGRPLTGRRRKWCGDDCERAWQRNHIWSMAKEWAKRRDGYKCVKCGNDGGEHRPKRYEKQSPMMLAQLGIEVPPGEVVHRIWRQNYSWLEVNHIDPRNGGGYNSGCHNHLSNLETLCHSCHVIETGLQRQRKRAEQDV